MRTPAVPPTVTRTAVAPTSTSVKSSVVTPVVSLSLVVDWKAKLPRRSPTGDASTTSSPPKRETPASTWSVALTCPAPLPTVMLRLTSAPVVFTSAAKVPVKVRSGTFTKVAVPVARKA